MFFLWSHSGRPVQGWQFCNRPYSWYPPSFHTLIKTDRMKATSHGFSGMGQTRKTCQSKKSEPSLFILDYQKWRTFHLEVEWQILWVEVFIVTFLNQYNHVLTANDNDINHVETWTVHFSDVSFLYNKQTQQRLLIWANFNHLFFPMKYHTTLLLSHQP